MPGPITKIRRLRTRLAALLCVLLLSAWLFSVWFVAGYRDASVSIVIRRGRLLVAKSSDNWSPPSEGWYYERLPSNGIWSVKLVEEYAFRLILGSLPEGYLTTHPELIRSDGWRRFKRDMGVTFGTEWPQVDRDPDSLSDVFVVTVPLWCTTLPLLIVTFFLRRHDRCWPRGCCQSCGYDLRGHADSGKCPECGESSDLVEPGDARLTVDGRND